VGLVFGVALPRPRSPAARSIDPCSALGGLEAKYVAYMHLDGTGGTACPQHDSNETVRFETAELGLVIRHRQRPKEIKPKSPSVSVQKKSNQRVHQFHIQNVPKN
jgi:hypothetical protein